MRKHPQAVEEEHRKYPAKPNMITDINSEDRLVQRTFADHLHNVLGWESIYAFNDETFGTAGTLGRASEREVVPLRDLRDASDLPFPWRVTGELAVWQRPRVDSEKRLA
jgi:hypothetical protein